MTIKNFLDSCIRAKQFPEKATAIEKLKKCTQAEFEMFFTELSLTWLLAQTVLTHPWAANAPEIDRQMKMQFSATEDDI